CGPMTRVIEESDGVSASTSKLARKVVQGNAHGSLISVAYDGQHFKTSTPERTTQDRPIFVWAIQSGQNRPGVRAIRDDSCNSCFSRSRDLYEIERVQ